jgi:PIN domain nuclease of toxin-antitoxin system
MNLLLDSHALLWALHDPGRMRREAVDAIRDPGRAVFFSAASAWELALKAATGKLLLPDHWLVAAAETGFLHLPVTAAEAQASALLPWHHADPFDRVLVAQAQAHGLTIASRDPLMTPYAVPVMTV